MVKKRRCLKKIPVVKNNKTTQDLTITKEKPARPVK